MDGSSRPRAAIGATLTAALAATVLCAAGCVADPKTYPEGPGCTNTCRFANDGECDDGGEGSDFWECDLGTDCNDCGPRRTGADPDAGEPAPEDAGEPVAEDAGAPPVDAGGDPEPSCLGPFDQYNSAPPCRCAADVHPRDCSHLTGGELRSSEGACVWWPNDGPVCTLVWIGSPDNARRWCNERCDTHCCRLRHTEIGSIVQEEWACAPSDASGGC